MTATSSFDAGSRVGAGVAATACFGACGVFACFALSPHALQASARPASTHVHRDTKA
jgi:hypothetical protein